VPPIITPDSETVWCVGEKVTVTWDTSNRPKEITNPKGELLLGHVNSDGSGGENLAPKSLAKNFLLAHGQISFVVPDVAPNNDYIVVLVGDSGDASQEFTIKAAEKD